MGKVYNKVVEKQKSNTGLSSLIEGLTERDPNIPEYDESTMLKEMEESGDDFYVMRKWTYYQLGVDPNTYNASIEYLLKKYIKTHNCYIDKNNKIKLKG